jgi:hypothetical protein
MPITKSIITILTCTILCSCGVNYRTIKTNGQDKKKLDQYLSAKTTVLIHYYNLETNEAESPRELVLLNFDNDSIYGTLRKPKETVHKKDTAFSLPQKRLDERLLVRDTNFVEPTKALHIYTYQKLPITGRVSITRNKIIRYETHELRSFFKYKADPVSEINPLEAQLRTKKVVLVYTSTQEDPFTALQLISPQIRNDSLVSAYKTTRKSPIPMHKTSVKFKPYIELNETLVSRDSLFHPEDILRINASSISKKESQLVIPLNQIEVHYTYYTNYKTNNQKTGRTLSWVIPSALVLISLLGFSVAI